MKETNEDIAVSPNALEILWWSGTKTSFFLAIEYENDNYSMYRDRTYKLGIIDRWLGNG